MGASLLYKDPNASQDSKDIQGTVQLISAMVKLLVDKKERFFPNFVFEPLTLLRHRDPAPCAVVFRGAATANGNSAAANGNSTAANANRDPTPSRLVPSRPAPSRPSANGNSATAIGDSAVNNANSVANNANSAASTGNHPTPGAVDSVHANVRTPTEFAPTPSPDNGILEVAQLLDEEASITITRILTKKKKHRKKNRDYENMVRDLQLNNDNDSNNKDNDNNNKDSNNAQEEVSADNGKNKPTFTFDTAL